MNITERMASFVVETHFDDIPPEGIALAKRAVIDCLGCALLGSAQQIGKIVGEFVSEDGARPVSTVVGLGLRTSPPLAALANGILAHAEDFDDVNHSMMGHPSPPLVPAALASGEYIRCSGREFIEAYVVGFEVETRVGLAINPGHYSRGWHATATLGVLGAAAASAKLLRLDRHQVRMALGLAASQASGIRQNFGSMTKSFHAGNAARGGVLASMLARRGYTADANILEAPLGFCNVLRGDTSVDTDRIVAGLGQEYELMRSGIAFKPYPSCVETHTGIEAAVGLIEQHGIRLGDIENVECAFSATMDSVMLHKSPKTGLEGKFSIEYCVARALLDKSVTLDHFSDEEVNRPDVRKVMGLITRRIDDTLPMMTVVMTIRLRNGQEFSTRRDQSKGWPANPMTYEELTAKYRDCARRAINASNVERSLGLLDKLDELDDVTKLARFFA